MTTGRAETPDSQCGGYPMNNQAIWQVVATLLAIAADLVIGKIEKHRRKEPNK
jgi:hypothetical protein